MPFFNWSDVIKDVEPGATLPAGMSRQAVIIDDTMLALHEAFPNLNVSRMFTQVLKFPAS